ncbi:MAG: hypothetical protein M3R08_09150 [Bacteroidota bacterium]|nr:hypothetical protein [Bacteroidota bacterium]
MTTGKKFAKRTSDHVVQKVLDHRTKSILNAVISEPRGRMLSAYLKAMQQEQITEVAPPSPR